MFIWEAQCLKCCSTIRKKWSLQLSFDFVFLISSSITVHLQYVDSRKKINFFVNILLECADTNGAPCNFTGWPVDKGSQKLCVKMPCLFQVIHVTYILINCFCLVVDVGQYYLDWVVCPGNNTIVMKGCIGVHIGTNWYCRICKQL